MNDYVVTIAFAKTKDLQERKGQNPKPVKDGAKMTEGEAVERLIKKIGKSPVSDAIMDIYKRRQAKLARKT